MLKRVRMAAVAGGAVFSLTLLVHGEGMAADSSVPQSWNVSPMTNGAYRESFEVAPAWVTRDGLGSVTDASPNGSFPARSNVWFDAGSKVLQLETGGEVISNMLAYAEGGQVSFAEAAVYVDVRVKFDTLSQEPDDTLLNNAKLSLFVVDGGNDNGNLAVSHAAGVSTNTTPLDTNAWYQVTVVLSNNLFDVLLNDKAVFSGLSVKSVGEGNTLESANFCGTGYIDNLYVSHGNPAYEVLGPTREVPPLRSSTGLSDEEITRLNRFLQEKNVEDGDLNGLSQAAINNAYLLNEIPSAATESGNIKFGVSDIKLTSPTHVQITAKLNIGSVLHNSEITGKIQLLGKTHESVEEWTPLEGAITLNPADFTGGAATYPFTIPAGGYKVFKAQIVAP